MLGKDVPPQRALRDGSLLCFGIAAATIVRYTTTHHALFGAVSVLLSGLGFVLLWFSGRVAA
ncbi:MAG: hypothetical protein ABEJ81_08725 [Haloferacaceae archaeon]